MVRVCVVTTFVFLCAAASLGETLLIPYDAFSDTTQATKVKKVVDHTTFRRRLNENRFDTTAEVLGFLLDRMVLTSAMMRHLGLEKYVIAKDANGTLTYDDKAGMTGTFEPVYATTVKRIFYGNGLFDLGLLGKVRGESVLVMDYCQEQPNVVCNTVTVFIRVHGLLGPLCRIAAPLLNGMVGRKSASLLDASVKLSELLASDPRKVYERIKNCADITLEQLNIFRESFFGVEEAPCPEEPAAQGPSTGCGT
ncbi:MAG: hypothetical protein HQ592_18090 [Planctomycetes bacterium]|nr:hypothetical protein [Planctomycetota bacterium]